MGQVNATEALYPEQVNAEDCVFHRQQCVWRMIDGQAEYVCYTIYAPPASQALPAVSGVRNSRSEYGVEIILIVAFLHYWIGLSLDHVCEVVQFFTGLELTKSQANALLNQLSADWSEQYEVIAKLLAMQWVI